MTERTLLESLEFATETAREAGQLLYDNLNTLFKINKKGRINLVTEMDLRAEALIIERIRSRFPEHQILTEETGSLHGDSSSKWIIDPLDGTTNYAHGYRFFCVSIALEVEGEVILGAVYDPVVRELFTAMKGRGAHLNGVAIQVSEEESLLDSMLSTGFAYEEEAIQNNLKLFNRLMMHSRGIRRDGSAALDLCYVACGRFEGFWELGLSAWDVAAGKLIVEEAGGEASRFGGEPCTIYDREILASNRQLHKVLGGLLSSKDETPGRFVL